MSDLPVPAAEMSTRALMARVWQQYLAQQKALMGFAMVCAAAAAVTTSLMAQWLDPAIAVVFGVRTLSRLPEVVMQHP
ncbi:MAG: hypothetical protein JF615_16935, partial [Asticcacaulis sp.]|nr:hypothetical protein [Asticcacaulis sp.]